MDENEAGIRRLGVSSRAPPRPSRGAESDCGPSRRAPRMKMAHTAYIWQAMHEYEFDHVSALILIKARCNLRAQDKFID